MQQSYVESTSKSRMLMNAFGGLNQTAACQPNEFRNSMNLSSDAYPYLTQRAKRNKQTAPYPIAEKYISAIYMHRYEDKVIGTTTISNTEAQVLTHEFSVTGGVLYKIAHDEDTLEAMTFEFYFFDEDDAYLGRGGSSTRFKVAPMGSKKLYIRITMKSGNWMDAWRYADGGTLRLEAIGLRASAIYGGKFAAVYGNSLYYDGEIIKEDIDNVTKSMLDYGRPLRDVERCDLLTMGAELIVMPHGYVYNTVTKEERLIRNPAYGFELDSLRTEEGTVDWSGPYSVSTVICNTEQQEILPEDMKEGETYYYKLRSAPYFANPNVSEERRAVVFNEVRRFFESFSTLESIMVSFYGDESSEYAATVLKTGVEESVTIEGYIKCEGSYPVAYMLISCPEYTGDPEARFFSASHNIPILDYYTVSKNRVWGCVYKDGLNEIRCCVPGKVECWEVFAGVSTDSFTVSIGEPGEFTGAFTYGDEPYFFKENNIMKIYGSYPENYQLYTFGCEGVQNGSARSIVENNGFLFYKSTNNFCIFSGSYPQSISTNLGFEKYRDVVAGTTGKKIYWSCIDEQGKEVLWVYDLKNNLWHQEEEERILDFCQDNMGNLYGANDSTIITFSLDKSKDEEHTEWYAETGLIGMDIPDQKSVSKYTLRADMEAGATLSVLASYDDGDFEPLYSCVGEGKISSHTFSVKPVRCDHLRLRLEGVGRCTVYSIAYTMEQRSEHP